MELEASIRFLERDIKKIEERSKRYGWHIFQDGIFVKVLLPQLHTSKLFRLSLFCYGYPRHLITAEFLPNPLQPNKILWPNDKEQMFRIRSSANGIPFICMAGLKTYIPESDETTVPYSSNDLHIANIITRIGQQIAKADCSYLEVNIQ